MQAHWALSFLGCTQQLVRLAQLLPSLVGSGKARVLFLSGAYRKQRLAIHHMREDRSGREESQEARAVASTKVRA